MSKVFSDWYDALSDFKRSIEKDLIEIRAHKAEVQTLREEMFSELNRGRYIRDDHRVIISAPEIIIGNVDSWGELLDSSGSTVIVRGNSVSLEGAGVGGSVETRAPRIVQRAVDPGNDGEEDVVGEVSEIISKAKNIVIQSHNEEGAFATPDLSGNAGSIIMHADTDMIFDASIKAETHKKEISSYISVLEEEKSILKSESDNLLSKFESLMNDLEDLLKSQNDLMVTEEDVRSNIAEVLENSETLESLMSPLFVAYAECSRKISQLAETTRKISALKKQHDNVITGEEYTDNATGSRISLSGERIELKSVDGENNYRENASAGVDVLSNKINFAAVNKDSSLKEKGKISLSAMNMELTTTDNKNLQAENDTLQKGEFEAKGNVLIRSKNICLESVDYEIAEKTYKEKELTNEGNITIRAEKVDISTNDTEGKATGQVSVNSKKIDLKSMDLDKENRTDKALSTGSSMMLVSEKMFLGNKDKDTESKLLQLSSETIGTFAKETYELQQGEKKSVIQASEGRIALSGDQLELYGDTTLNSKTTFKSDITGPKAEFDSVTAKSHFKSPNISDGMAAAGGGGGGTLTAKLQKEEVPQENNNN